MTRAVSGDHHPRVQIVRKAKTDFLRLLIDFEESHQELTYIELAQLFAEAIQGSLKFALRVERHGNDSDPADLA